MNYSLWSRFSNELLKVENGKDLIIRMVMRDVLSEKLKLLKKGLVLKEFSMVEFGDDGDSFVRNLKVARISCHRYQIPRFLKSVYYKSKSYLKT